MPITTGTFTWAIRPSSTIPFDFGAKVIAGDTGFFLNDEWMISSGMLYGAADARAPAGSAVGVDDNQEVR